MAEDLQATGDGREARPSGSAEQYNRVIVTMRSPSTSLVALEGRGRWWRDEGLGCFVFTQVTHFLPAGMVWKAYTSPRRTYIPCDQVNNIAEFWQEEADTKKG